MTPEVRLATRADFAPLAGTLARAFYDDPVTRYFYSNDRRRMGQAEKFFNIRLRQLEPQNVTYTTPDHSGGAIWTRPDRWREDLRQTLMLLPMIPALLPNILRSGRAVREIEKRHPVEPHYYLSVLGTEPKQQGGGIGSALLGPVLEMCDAGGLGAYLESSKESNLSFYERHGFAVTERIELPDGPPLWLMWRQAPSGRSRPGCSPADR